MEIRKFDTGATRNIDADREDPEGFLSPIVMDRFCEYMSKHRLQADGSLRESDNWQKGIPLKAYMKGLMRHVKHLWTRHRGFKVTDPKAGVDIEEDLCAIIFNAQGYLHEIIKERYVVKPEANALTDEEFFKVPGKGVVEAFLRKCPSTDYKGPASTDYKGPGCVCE